MTTIDLALLSTVTGGAATTLGADLLKSVDEFGTRLQRSSGRQVHNFNMCEYTTANDAASGDPARVAKAAGTNCFDRLAPLRTKR